MTDARAMWTSVEIAGQEYEISEFLRGARVVCEDPGTGKGSAAGELDAEQLDALRTCMLAGASAIAGGAGVGKTTVVQELVRRVLDTPNAFLEVVACALTHKAKKVLSGRLPAHARLRVSTIHSLLAKKAQGVKNTKKTSDNTSLFLVVDEASMLDYELLAGLAETAKEYKQYQVCFVGDHAQLPPIGRGEFFRRVVEGRPASPTVRVAVLQRCYRVSGGMTRLLDAASHVRDGLGLPSAAPEAGWQFVETASDAEAMEVVRSMVSAMTKADVDATQIIAWQNADVQRVNEFVQGHLVSIGALGAARDRGQRFLPGDRVVYVGENQPGGVTNATAGVVASVSTPDTVEVLFEDGQKKTIVGARELQKQLVLAYCSTVHKAQGSEYRRVIVPCFEVAKMKSVLDRRWLYTAMTRAREDVVLIGTRALLDFVTSPIKAAPETGIFDNPAYSESQ
jgi:exodeoxyribonuclease V alpha subunit